MCARGPSLDIRQQPRSLARSLSLFLSLFVLPWLSTVFVCQSTSGWGFCFSLSLSLSLIKEDWERHMYHTARAPLAFDRERAFAATVLLVTENDGRQLPQRSASGTTAAAAAQATALLPHLDSVPLGCCSIYLCVCVCVSLSLSWAKEGWKERKKEKPSPPLSALALASGFCNAFFFFFFFLLQRTRPGAELRLLWPAGQSRQDEQQEKGREGKERKGKERKGKKGGMSLPQNDTQ